jgi:hypothetical protein
LFGDESDALTHPNLAHVWAKRGADLRIPAPGYSAKVALLGVLDWAGRKLVVQTSYGPEPGRCVKPVRLVLVNGPIHTSKASTVAPAQRAHWLKVEWLPESCIARGSHKGGRSIQSWMNIPLGLSTWGRPFSHIA